MCCNDCEAQGAGSGCAEGCSHPEHKQYGKSHLQEAREKIEQVKDIQGALDALARDERRMAFVGALYAKAETSHLRRLDALIILQATLAEMLTPAITGLVQEAEKIEHGTIARFNADLMVEIAKELQAEALKIVDHAMANSGRLVLVTGPGMPR